MSTNIYENIYDPTYHKYVSIYSARGKNILSTFIANYQNGGSEKEEKCKDCDCGCEGNFDNCCENPVQISYIDARISKLNELKKLYVNDADTLAVLNTMITDVNKLKDSIKNKS